jgi:hypothetical protein
MNLKKQNKTKQKTPLPSYPNRYNTTHSLTLNNWIKYPETEEDPELKGGDQLMVTVVRVSDVVMLCGTEGAGKEKLRNRKK